jgi:membrane associated rhomboid family serine protease
LTFIAFQYPAFAADELAFSTEHLLQGKVWTLVTSLFVHANLLHLVGNLVFLYIFSSTLEKQARGRVTLAAFLGGGMLAFILSIPFYPSPALLVGASAAIFTLGGAAMLVDALKPTVLFFLPVGFIAILFFTFNLLAVIYHASGNTAYQSHLIGFAIGLPIGASLSSRWPRNLLISLAMLGIYFLVAPFLIGLLRAI